MLDNSGTVFACNGSAKPTKLTAAPKSRVFSAGPFPSCEDGFVLPREALIEVLVDEMLFFSTCAQFSVRMYYYSLTEQGKNHFVARAALLTSWATSIPTKLSSITTTAKSIFNRAMFSFPIRPRSSNWFCHSIHGILSLLQGNYLFVFISPESWEEITT